MKNALIIFVRNPILGKVKSRLAATLGREKTLDIYKVLLAHTNNIYAKLKQEGSDLGGRMKNAFAKLFEQGYKKIMIIGSDCYDLTSDIINEGYKVLSKNEIVIGPASDGGYYLLGMKKFIPQLFDNKRWSTNTVFIDTISQIKELKFTVGLLSLLSDVDVESDIVPGLLRRFRQIE